jgi:DNA-binding NtrC family response regulator
LAQGETVLLVDDDKALMTLGGKMLAELGYQVLTANTPGEAKQMAEEYSKTIHLLVTDVVMPEMNGRDLAKQLNKLYPDLKVLYMSGYTTNVIMHRGVLDEGVNFVQKPIRIELLATKVRAALDLPNRNDGDIG